MKNGILECMICKYTAKEKFSYNKHLNEEKHKRVFKLY